MERLLKDEKQSERVLKKLEEYFGPEWSRTILNLIKSFVLRRTIGLMNWASWWFSSVEIAGITLDVKIDRVVRDTGVSVIIDVDIVDVDPVTIKNNLREIIRRARWTDKQLLKFTRTIEPLLEKLERGDEVSTQYSIMKDAGIFGEPKGKEEEKHSEGEGQ